MDFQSQVQTGIAVIGMLLFYIAYELHVINDNIGKLVEKP